MNNLDIDDSSEYDINDINYDYDINNINDINDVNNDSNYDINNINDINNQDNKTNKRFFKKIKKRKYVSDPYQTGVYNREIYNNINSNDLKISYDKGETVRADMVTNGIITTDVETILKIDTYMSKLYFNNNIYKTQFYKYFIGQTIIISNNVKYIVMMRKNRNKNFFFYLYDKIDIDKIQPSDLIKKAYYADARSYIKETIASDKIHLSLKQIPSIDNNKYIVIGTKGDSELLKKIRENKFLYKYYTVQDTSITDQGDIDINLDWQNDYNNFNNKNIYFVTSFKRYEKYKNEFTKVLGNQYNIYKQNNGDDFVKKNNRINKELNRIIKKQKKTKNYLHKNNVILNKQLDVFFNNDAILYVDITQNNNEKNMMHQLGYTEIPYLENGNVVFPFVFYNNNNGNNNGGVMRINSEETHIEKVKNFGVYNFGLNDA
jgi:hypothetical protein